MRESGETLMFPLVGGEAPLWRMLSTEEGSKCCWRSEEGSEEGRGGLTMIVCGTLAGGEGSGRRNSSLEARRPMREEMRESRLGLTREVAEEDLRMGVSEAGWEGEGCRSGEREATGESPRELRRWASLCRRGGVTTAGGGTGMEPGSPI